MRRLLLAGNLLVDENTLFFNDGTNFVDESPENLKITNNGDWVQPSTLDGESCWFFPMRTVNGIEGTPFVTFPSTNKSVLYNAGVLTLEFMFNMKMLTGNCYICSYGIDMYNYVFQLLTMYTGAGATLTASINNLNQSNHKLMQISSSSAFVPEKWHHTALTLTNIPNSNNCEYAAYYDGKYASVITVPQMSGNLENMASYTIGNDSGIYLNNGISAPGVAGIKKIRLSKTDRYKKKDYIPYVNN